MFHLGREFGDPSMTELLVFYLMEILVIHLADLEAILVSQIGGEPRNRSDTVRLRRPFVH